MRDCVKYYHAYEIVYANFAPPECAVMPVANAVSFGNEYANILDLPLNRIFKLMNASGVGLPASVEDRWCTLVKLSPYATDSDVTGFCVYFLAALKKGVRLCILHLL